MTIVYFASNLYFSVFIFKEKRCGISINLVIQVSNENYFALSISFSICKYNKP